MKEIVMFRMTRKLMMIAAAAAALGGTSAGAALAAITPPAAAVIRSAPRCEVQNLSASLHGPQIAAGYRGGFILTLTNTGQWSCSLDGYPGLGLLDRAHRAVPSRTFWGPTWFDPDPGRQLIVLSPGETASASLAWTSGALRGSAVFAAYLMVTPPDDFSHLVIPLSRPVVEIPVYRGDLHVTALARHTPHS
jgi:Protein of unknown function (DUF4232)